MKIGDTVIYVGNDGLGRPCYPDTQRGRVIGLVDMHGYPSAEVQWEPGSLTIPPSPAYCHNLSVIGEAMKIDITKPLVLVSSYAADPPVPVKLLGTDPTGNLIVDLTSTKKDSDWMIFTPEGRFHRSGNGGGRALSLENEKEKITHRFTASFVDGAVFFGPVVGPACDVQIITQGDKITSIVARAE